MLNVYGAMALIVLGAFTAGVSLMEKKYLQMGINLAIAIYFSIVLVGVISKLI
jgi:hypothetical protein